MLSTTRTRELRQKTREHRAKVKADQEVARIARFAQRKADRATRLEERRQKRIAALKAAHAARKEASALEILTCSPEFVAQGAADRSFEKPLEPLLRRRPL